MGQDSLSGYDVDVSEEGEHSSFVLPAFLSGSSLPRTCTAAVCSSDADIICIMSAQVPSSRISLPAWSKPLAAEQKYRRLSSIGGCWLRIVSLRSQDTS